MRLHGTLKGLFAVAVIALITGPAGAQAPQSPAVAAGGTGAGSASGQVSLTSDANLSPAEMETRANGFVTQMEVTSAAISKRQLRAVSDGDVVLANCLKDKLSQINTALRSARERQANLRNPDLRAHTYTIIVVQKGNADRAAREAQQCIGKDATIAGDTRVTTRVDVFLPPDDDRNGGYPTIDPPSVIVPPPIASPAQ